MSDTRQIYSDTSGYLDGEKVADDETCIVFSNVTRIAAIKLLGNMSRMQYEANGLTDHEAQLLERLYYILQC